MTRTDLYATVHKGIRALLCDTLKRVARTDFAAVDQAAGAAAAVQRLLEFLDEHARHEDEVIMPEIAALSPELHALLAADHAQIDGAHGEIARLLRRLADATAAERGSLGRKLHEQLGGLVADHLRHMQREECAANRMLWAHRSDEQLEALQRHIVATLALPRLAQWLELVLPAVHPRERAGLLQGMRRALPDAAFAEVTAPARAALGEAEWSAAPFASANGSAR